MGKRYNLDEIKKMNESPAESIFSAETKAKAEQPATAEAGEYQRITLNVPKGYVIPDELKQLREKKSVRLQLLVTPSLLQVLKDTAAAQHTSVNDLVFRTLTDKFMEG